MPQVLTFRPSTSEPVADTAELAGLATCPGCYTADPSLTMVAVDAGAAWRCVRCTQQWDAVRLATVAAYMTWLSEHAVSPVDRATLARSGRGV
jgi:hypothetical protein